MHAFDAGHLDIGCSGWTGDEGRRQPGCGAQTVECFRYSSDDLISENYAQMIVRHEGKDAWTLRDGVLQDNRSCLRDSNRTTGQYTFRPIQLIRIRMVCLLKDKPLRQPLNGKIIGDRETLFASRR